MTRPATPPAARSRSARLAATVGIWLLIAPFLAVWLYGMTLGLRP